MTVLLTGFDAFGDYAENPSASVVEAIAAEARGTVVGSVLPTSYARAGRSIERLLLNHRPQAALLLGLHSRARQLVFEQVARNCDHSRAADNDGQRRVHQIIIPGGPDQYPGTLPWRALRDRARLVGATAVDSDDAGGFVCNHVYYRAVHCVVTRALPTRVGFVHLPEFSCCTERDLLLRCIGGFVELLSGAGPGQPRP